MKYDKLPRNLRQLKRVDYLLFIGAVTLAIVILVLTDGLGIAHVRDLWQFAFAIGLAMFFYCVVYIWENRRH